MSEDLNGINCDQRSQQERFILISFYFTQLLFILLSVPYLWWKNRLYVELAPFTELHMWLVGVGVGGFIVAMEFVLIRLLPEHHFDDGGLNQLLFARRPWWHIMLIAVMAAIGEELLFRGLVQGWIGVWGTALLFALVHTRYLKKWVLVVFVTGVGTVFGLMVEWTGHLAPAVIAHAVVDFVMGCYLRYGAKG
ncbi:CPBP family intramembrane glutamic endopeptidase [Laceyella tengchongensis]